jgi:uncharacterized metal-binding protein YceD (DUF177 family)
MFKRQTPEEMIQKAKIQKQIREEKMTKIPPEFRCEMSYTGAHMFDVFTNGEHKFVAICSRCLKRVPISTD